MKTRKKFLTVDVKTVPSDGTGTFSGLAATFDDTPDRQNDVIQRGAFAKSILDWRSRGGYPPLYWMHQHDDPDALVGKLSSMMEIESGLLVSGKLSLKSALSLSCYERLLDGSLSSLSIGYAVEAEHERADGANVITRCDLLEVSLVGIPANPRAAVLAVKDAANGPNREIAAINERLAALEIRPATKSGLDLVDQFIAEQREERRREREEAERIVAAVAATVIPFGQMLPSEQERTDADRERFERFAAEVERRDAEREREAAIRDAVDAARRGGDVQVTYGG